MDRRAFLTQTAGLVAATTLAGAAPPVSAGGHGRLGTFEGPARYGAGGTAELAGNQVNLLDDFVFGSAPDPKVALGNSAAGGYDPATLMGPLTSTSGASSYTVPDGIDASDYDQVWIWCERFDVPLAMAQVGS